MPEVFVALGSNLGDRKKNLARARSAMQRIGITPLAASSIYETAPWGPVKQEHYLNQVLRCVTKLKPHALLQTLRRIEKSLGRDRSREQRFGPRTMDLDILLYQGVHMRTKALQLPHPRMMQRAFVLVPLAEISSGLIVSGMPIRSALQRLELSGIANL